MTAPARTERALEAIPAAVMVLDTTDTVLAWNAAAEALFDIPAGGAVARKFRDLDVSDRVEGLRARIDEVKGRHAPVKMEDATFSRRSGELVHADISILPLFEASRLVGILVFAAEATAHVRLEEQMGRIAEQHATAIEELHSTNEELETTNEELQFTNEELETTVEELQAANTELATLNAELEGRTAELTRLDAFHHSLLDSLEQGIAVLDRDGVVTSWNQMAGRMWGLRAEQAVNRPFFALPIGEVVQRARPAFESALATTEPAVASGVPYTLPGGSARRGTLRMVPMRRVNEIVGVIAVMGPDEGSNGPSGA